MRLRFALCALTLASAAGCATAGGLRLQPLSAGVTHTYEAPLDRVAAAARQAMLGLGFSVSDASQPSPTMWMMVGEKGASLVSYGELVRVLVQEGAGGQTTVRVLTQRRLATNIFARGDWSEPIFEQILVWLQKP